MPPQRHPGDEAGDLHQDEREQRRVLVRGHYVPRHIGPVLQHRLRRAAGEIGGDGHQSEEKEPDEAGLLQVLALLHQRRQQQAERDAKANRRKVIEQQMQVREVHETNSAM